VSLFMRRDARRSRRRLATQGEHLANWTRALGPDGERLVAYLELRTAWDS
jgi:hypothetical protein